MTLHKFTDYHGDARLLADMHDLLAASYEKVGPFALKGLAEPVPGMEHELYTLRDPDGRLAAFYTVGYHHSGSTPYCYLGLSAVRDDCKGQGLSSRLHRAHLADCRVREARNGHRTLLYFTTATPLIFAWFTRTLAEVAPTASGQYNELGRQRLRTIAAAQYPQATWDAATPWLLRGAAPDVRYSAHEAQRLGGVRAGLSTAFFTAVQLDERLGDRLLVVGYAPL